jgi:putative spermidine/putrescine transport system ATP-binding protein
MSGYLRLEGLTKRFPGASAAAVDDVSLAVPRGAILALLGPSGSGKTTTLRLLAGFEEPDAGRVIVEREDVTALPAARRRFGMVFQHYALFPHLDVGDNVGFGLDAQGVGAADRARRIGEALEQVDLAGFERRRVTELSGGQQQRVALARALAPEPRVLLLDEPLSNLDPALRERTRRELRAVIERVGITTVIVTHEQEEAFDLGDRVALLRDGKLEQEGPPEELYGSPATPFVAAFVGRSSSILATALERSARGWRVEVGGAVWDVEASAAAGVGPGPVRLVARPEALWLSAPGATGALDGIVDARRFLGSTTLYAVRTGAGEVLEVSAPLHAAVVGSRVGVVPSRRTGGGIHLFPGRD